MACHFSTKIYVLEDYGFEIVIRTLCFVVISAIFGLMEFGTGMNQTQLKVLLITWLMCTIHFGSASVYPIETLAVLTVTLSPMYDKFVAMFPAAYIPAKSPSSPSSVPQEPTHVVKAGKSELPLFVTTVTDVSGSTFN